MVKQIELPSIPKWLANQIEITKEYQKDLNKCTDVTDDFVFDYLLRNNHATPYDFEYLNANGKYIAEHMIDVAIAVKYGYEVEDE